MSDKILASCSGTFTTSAERSKESMKKDYYFKEKQYYEARIKHLEKLLADNNIAEPNVLVDGDE